VNGEATAAGTLELAKIFYANGETYHCQQFISLREKITWKLH
jgi:hypothetical protein